MIFSFVEVASCWHLELSEWKASLMNILMEILFRCVLPDVNEYKMAKPMNGIVPVIDLTH